MLQKVKILGIGIHKVDLQGAVGIVEEFIAEGSPHLVVTANSEFVMMAQEDEEFRHILEEAHLVTPDGVGVVWAAKHLGEPLTQRVTGIDLLNNLLPVAQKKGYRIFLLGGKPGVAEKAGKEMKKSFPDLKIVGTHHGYLRDPGAEQEAIAQIMEGNPQILFVAMGAPTQEKWAWKHMKELGVPVSIGIGGSLDVWAGNVKRAPQWMQNAGLEWFYRLAKQPSRFVRMLALPRFVMMVTFGSREKK